MAGWCPMRALAMSTVFKFACASGVRANEPTNKNDYIKRSAFALVRGHTKLRINATNLESARNGDYIKRNADGSKCDRDATEWGDRDAYATVPTGQRKPSKLRLGVDRLGA